MAELFTLLISIVEILILGVFAFVTFAYFIAIFHPFKKYLLNYYNEVLNFLGKDGITSEYKKYFQAFIFFGLIYYGGTLINIVDYWFLQPLHLKVITEVEKYDESKQGKTINEKDLITETKETKEKKSVTKASTDKEDTSTTKTETTTYKTPKKERYNSNIDSDDYNRSVWNYIMVPIKYNILYDNSEVNPKSVKNYLCYLNRSSSWGNSNPEVSSGSLSDLRKFIRLIRGTAFISFLFLLIALSKCMIACFVCFFKKDGKFRILLHRHFIDPEVESETVKSNPIRKIFLPNIVIAIFSLFIYTLSIKSYVFLEREFHSTVIEGQSTMPSKNENK